MGSVMTETDYFDGVLIRLISTSFRSYEDSDILRHKHI